MDQMVPQALNGLIGGYLQEGLQERPIQSTVKEQVIILKKLPTFQLKGHIAKSLNMESLLKLKT